MNTSMHGKKIQQIIFPGGPGLGDPVVRSGPLGQLELSATYHGDREEFWILQIKDGIEIARHNTRLVESIVWAEDTSDSAGAGDA